MPNKAKTEATTGGESSKLNIFAYPVTFSPVPYHAHLSYSSLLSTIIPISRSVRQIPIKLPSSPASVGETDMEIDQQPQVRSATVEVESDGLLLYVSQASYESGTSPLSSWVPLVSYTPGKPSPLLVLEK